MSTSSTSYRPDIDGLRGLAMLLVLAYHYGASWIPGSFTTLDAFFIVSGFLITSIVRREMLEGTFSLLGFYERRIRRIIPALAVMLVGVMIAGWLFFSPGDYDSAGQSAAFAAVGAGNLFFYWHTGYFDQAAAMQPLLHTWSLGVEEQFYLAWPLLLWGLLTWLPGRGARLAVLALAVAVGCIYAGYVVGIDPKAAYYLPLPRAWEFALGGLMAFAPPIPARYATAGAAMGGAGLLLIGWSCLSLTTDDPFPGFNALYACCGSAILVWPRERVDAVGWLLALPPLRFTGMISYSLYLWHWPVLVLFRNYVGDAPPTRTEILSLVVLVYVIAAASWWFVERPFRRPRRHRWRVVGVGVATALAVVWVGTTVTAHSGFPARLSDQVEAMSSLDVMWAWPCPARAPVEGLDNFCQFGVPWETATTRAILWGDSHAEHLAPLLEPLALASNTAVVIYNGCTPYVDGVHVFRYYPRTPAFNPACARLFANGVGILKSNPDIDLVIFSAAWANVIGGVYTDTTEEMSQSGNISLTVSKLRELMADVAQPGRRFVLLGDVPQWHFDPMPCQTRQFGLLRRPCAPEQEAVSVADYESYQGWERDAFWEATAAFPGTEVLIPGDRMCAGAYCVAEINGEPLYRDASHLRRNLSPKTRLELGRLLQLGAIFANQPITSVGTLGAGVPGRP